MDLTPLIVLFFVFGVLFALCFHPGMWDGVESWLSLNQRWLNWIGKVRATRASVEDSKAGEFNGVTLEVNPKPESEQGMITPALIGGLAGGMLGGLFLGDDFWKDAPAWANFWAKDRSGVAYWYERRPVLNDDWWSLPQGSTQKAKVDMVYQGGCGWQDSLIKRPGIQEQQP